MPKKRKAEAAQTALGDEPTAPPKLEIDGAGWHVRTIALGYYRADLSELRAEKLAAALKLRYPRAAVRVIVAARYGDRVVSSLIAPLRLVGIGADDGDGARARAFEVARLREEATREVLAFVERWTGGGDDGDDPAR